jgi:hypothetical protein
VSTCRMRRDAALTVSLLGLVPKILRHLRGSVANTEGPLPSWSSRPDWLARCAEPASGLGAEGG